MSSCFDSPWKKLPNRFWTLYHQKMCLLLSVWHSHISSSSHLCSIPVLLWIIIRVCDEHQNAFLLKPGCRTTPGRKEVDVFFLTEILKKMTADRCLTLGGNWCCLRTWIGAEGDAYQTLVIVYFTEYSWARSGGCGACHLATGKWDAVSFIFTPPRFLSYFCFSAWESASFCKGFHGEWIIGTMWVPMGMVDQTAPKRWCSSAVSFSCFTAARLSHDMTHS